MKETEKEILEQQAEYQSQRIAELEKELNLEKGLRYTAEAEGYRYKIAFQMLTKELFEKEKK